MTDYRSLFRDALVIAASVRREGGYRLMAGAEIEAAPPGGRTGSRRKLPKRKTGLGRFPLPNLWLRITPDNLITVFIGKSEMGQGVCTALPMIVAGELDADLMQIRFEMSPAGEEYTDPEWGVQKTGGSTSVRHLCGPLRKAGAAAREMLLKAAAGLWGVPSRECEVRKGKVLYKKDGESAAYGDLCLRAAELSLPKNPPLRGDNGVIGRPVPRLDVPDKVAGTVVFGMDVFVPGMLYATIARPLAFGAKAVSFDKQAAGKVPGVWHVVRIAGGIGICADSISSAWKGRDALNVEWGRGSYPALGDESVEKLFLDCLDRKGRVAGRDGDAAREIGRTARKVGATYFLPYLAHAAMEPMNCTAHVLPDRCDIWAPTQDQSGVIQAAAGLTGLEPSQILVHATYLGGGFGRRLETDYAEEAVLLSRAVGRPVKVIWTREEDMKNDFYRPGCCARMEGGLDHEGRFAAWSQKVVVPSIFARVSPGAIDQGIDPAAVEGLAETEYEVPHIRTEYVRMDLPVPVGFWRAVGHSHNAFIVESFVAEMATAAEKDPLEFPLGLLRRYPRAARVLEVAAEKAGWRRLIGSGKGRGIAQHFSYGSYVAEIAEVTVDNKTGRMKVDRIVCAVDCGPVINPSILVAQVEGGIIFGLRAALKEAIPFDSGGVKSANFDSYGILSMKEAPAMEVHVIPSDEEIGGIGEVCVPPVAPAVGNAVFDAAGVWIRRLPIERELKKLLAWKDELTAASFRLFRRG